MAYSYSYPNFVTIPFSSYFDIMGNILRSDVVRAIKLEIKLSTAMCSYQSLVQIAGSWSRYRDPFE